MTSLDLTPQSALANASSDPPVRRFFDRIPWPTVLPWIVVALMFFGDGYHRLQMGAQQLEDNQAAITALQMAVGELNGEIRELRVIVARLEQAQRDAAPVRRVR